VRAAATRVTSVGQLPSPWLVLACRTPAFMCTRGAVNGGKPLGIVNLSRSLRQIGALRWADAFDRGLTGSGQPLKQMLAGR
jgi:hypothetical protein